MENSKAKFKLKKLIKELSKYSARHTELISVYVPAGYNLNLINQQLDNEYGTSENIKSKQTRKNVQMALKKMLQQLKVYKKTPGNGLALFCGNIAENPGVLDFEIWAIEPPRPLDVKIYKCDQIFHLDPLKKMLEPTKIYGLIVIDKQGASIGYLKGANIELAYDDTSLVPGKTRKGGQCLDPETLIQLTNGDIIKIKDAHTSLDLKGINFEKFKTENTQITDKWETNKNSKFIIITKNPRQKIVCSKDHLFFVYNEKIEEKPAEKLRVGDLLLMPEQIDIKGSIQDLESINYQSYSISNNGVSLLKKKRIEKKLLQRVIAKKVGVTQTEISLIELNKRNVNKEILRKILNVLEINSQDFFKKYCKFVKRTKLPKRLNSDLAQIIGYLIGDGSIDNNRIDFFEANEEVAIKYKNKLEKIFDEFVGLKFRKDKNYYQLRLYSKEAVLFINKNFPEVKKSLDSFIPSKILMSKKEIIAGFLRGIFDAEGYVSRGRIGLGINNELLANQIQSVLLRYGIIASCLEYNNKKNIYSNNTRYIIEISEHESLKRFKENIGFSLKNNMIKLSRAISTRTKKNYTRQILTSGKKIREIIESSGLKVNDFPKVSSFFLNKRAMSKYTFKNSILKLIHNPLSYNKLLEEYNKRVIPVKIKEIRKEKASLKMIDISTNNTNFIANNLIVHNSAARYARVREGLEKDWFKNIAERAKKEFENVNNLQGILLGGPGPAKEEFANYLPTNIKRKIIATESTSYTGEQGLQELVEKSKKILAREQVTREKELVERFFSTLRENPQLAAYGKEEIEKALQMGAIDTLLISEEANEEEFEEYVEQLDREGGKWEIISSGTREGIQLTNLGNYAAILRFPIE